MSARPQRRGRRVEFYLPDDLAARVDAALGPMKIKEWMVDAVERKLTGSWADAQPSTSGAKIIPPAGVQAVTPLGPTPRTPWAVRTSADAKQDVKPVARPGEKKRGAA